MNNTMPSKNVVPKKMFNRLDYSLRRYYVDEYLSRNVSLIPIAGSVLDLGGNKIRKRGAFDIEKYGLRVVYANLSIDKLPDVQTDASYVPFMDNTFDAVICSELLEHVPEPMSVLREAWRLLKPGGLMLICVPFLVPIHGDPDDYGRYTDTFWLKALEQSGWSDILIEKQWYFWSVLLDFIRAYLHQRIKEGRPRTTFLQQRIKGIVARTKHMALRRDARHGLAEHPFYTKFTTGFGINAEKQLAEKLISETGAKE
ncbi:MAG: class I SAM-dependent methyltransferase [Candidatus Alcyoniella australis]|nr:class I SAM-dependent methyltransferase [Candidatus Alcyoniella australis]